MLSVAILFCLTTQQAHGNTSRDGWGLFVADDEWNFLDPNYTIPSLEDHFAKLNPKVFRLQTIWNTMDRPEWKARTHAMIDRARARGANYIILTVRSNNPSNVGPEGYFPTSTQYKTKIAALVNEFASKVDAWGAANEPNGKWRPDDAPDGYAQLPAVHAAAYHLRMREARDQYDASAVLTSPDFLDDWGTSPQVLKDYVHAFGLASGGDWGDVVAFHPYRDVELALDPSKQLTYTNALISEIPPGKNIWVTEVGAQYESDQDQNARVAWIVNTLATQPRISRMAYYNMHGTNPNWDTALLNADFIRRPAWYTWCSAAHNDNPGHAECAPDQAVVGDWDGNGSDTVGLFRPSSSTWYLRNSNSYGSAHKIPYGFPGAIPISGDWDGNGTDTIGLYVPSTGMWSLRNSNSVGSPDFVFQYGFQGTIPVAGDWNNDGTDTIGLYTPSTAMWYLRNSNSSGQADYSFQYGFQGTRPVTGDWNNDGVDTIGLYAASNFTWYLRNSNSSGAAGTFQYGFAGPEPVAGDWNSDGSSTIGLYAPLTTIWYLRYSNSAGPSDNVFYYGAPG